MKLKQCKEYCTQRKDYTCCYECDKKCKLDPICKVFPADLDYKKCENRSIKND